AATSAAVLPATDLLRLRRCPAERHRNLVRVELPAIAVVTGLAILPLLRLERPGDGDPVALADGLGDVLGLVAPHGDAEAVLRPVDVLVALLLALRLHHHERRDRDAGLREPQLGVVREVAGDGEGVIGHGSGLLRVLGQGLSLLGEVRQPSLVVDRLIAGVGVSRDQPTLRPSLRAVRLTPLVAFTAQHPQVRRAVEPRVSGAAHAAGLAVVELLARAGTAAAGIPVAPPDQLDGCEVGSGLPASHPSALRAAPRVANAPRTRSSRWTFFSFASANRV